MNRIGASIALGSVVFSGCQAAPNSSFTPGTANAPAVVTRQTPNAGIPSGIYEALVPNYDGHLGRVRVIVQLGPAASSCQSSVFMIPTAQQKTGFTSWAYHSPMTVSQYSVRHGRAYVVATAKLGSDLGMLRVEGLVESKSFQMLYRDRRGGGTMTAGYVEPCKPVRLQTGSASAQAFLGAWRVALSDSTFGQSFKEQSATMNITKSDCLTTGCSAVKLIGQITRTDSGTLPLMKSPLPYCVQGVWTDFGTWNVTIDSTSRADGTCTSKPGTGELAWWTAHWFPPGGDRTYGGWDAFNDPDDDAPASGGIFSILGR